LENVVAVTPIRKVRVPQEIWEPASARAQRERISLASLIRGYLSAYGKGSPMGVILTEDDRRRLRQCSEFLNYIESRS
jgi:hypothetical protein